MKLSIFTTATDPIRRGDPFFQAMECYEALADEVVLNSQPWPQEFEWTHIADMFQQGYEACTGSWVLHCDLDFIFHEVDYRAIRKACEENNDAPALSFWKHQYIMPDRYNLKSRLVLAVNKGKFGDRIKFDGGGEQDLCQPSLDGKYIEPMSVPEARIPFNNYNEILKTKEQLLEDKGRFARAWQRTFGEYKLGGPDDQSAYDEYLKMVLGRYNKSQQKVDFESHPTVIKGTIKNLTPENWGYSGFDLIGKNDYVKN